jgi:hypothetical protein
LLVKGASKQKNRRRNSFTKRRGNDRICNFTAVARDCVVIGGRGGEMASIRPPFGLVPGTGAGQQKRLRHFLSNTAAGKVAGRLEQSGVPLRTLRVVAREETTRRGAGKETVAHHDWGLQVNPDLHRESCQDCPGDLGYPDPRSCWPASENWNSRPDWLAPCAELAILSSTKQASFSVPDNEHVTCTSLPNRRPRARCRPQDGARRLLSLQRHTVGSPGRRVKPRGDLRRTQLRSCRRER